MAKYSLHKFSAAQAMLLALFIAASQAFAIPHALHLRMVENQIQLGTDTNAPAFYVQYRSPTTDWQTWTSKSIVPAENSGVWFRAIFESNPEDPMEWELAEDVDQVLSQGGAIETEGQLYWSVIGEFDADGTFIAAYDKNPDPMMALASEPPPVTYDQPTQNNQAVAVPDPGTVRLYWFNRTTRKSYLWHLSDSGTQKAGLYIRPSPASTGWNMVGSSDFDGNGTKDILWHNSTTGYALIWHLDADGMFSHSQYVREPPASTAWEVVDVSDIMGDGKPEILWSNRSTGHTYMWFLKSDGTFDRGQFVRETSVDLAWQIACTADMNGSGVRDIIWFNRQTGLTYIWFLDNNGVFERGQYVRSTPVATSWRIVGSHDFDNNGVPDLIWHNLATGATHLWTLDANAVFVSGTPIRSTPVSTVWQIAGLQDVSNNGRPEIVWHNRNTGQIFLWNLSSQGIYTSGQLAREAGTASAWAPVVVSN